MQRRILLAAGSVATVAIPDLHADSSDVTIRSRVGPEFATTRRPTHPGEITAQAGPKSATIEGQTGASSGDHTHAFSALGGDA
jgi:hypothetical protein